MANHRMHILSVAVAILAVTVPATAARVRQTLADGWYAKQLESANPDSIVECHLEEQDL